MSAQKVRPITMNDDPPYNDPPIDGSGWMRTDTGWRWLSPEEMQKLLREIFPTEEG